VKISREIPEKKGNIYIYTILVEKNVAVFSPVSPPCSTAFFDDSSSSVMMGASGLLALCANGCHHFRPERRC
jgi:hypothetical protein